PDIIGKGIGNPIGQIWTAKMMLDHMGEEEIGTVLLDVVESVTNDGIVTPDIGGKHTTTEVTEEINSRLKARA
ncbi:isocitrate/isopropylmalate family dehydrogenase, partial [Staphylococcus sp. SIMBA_130]